MSDDEDLTWTTGKNPRFTHIRLIDFGAFGEVHGVCLPMWSMLIRGVAPRRSN